MNFAAGDLSLLLTARTFYLQVFKEGAPDRGLGTGEKCAPEVGKGKEKAGGGQRPGQTPVGWTTLLGPGWYRLWLPGVGLLLRLGRRLLPLALRLLLCLPLLFLRAPSK